MTILILGGTAEARQLAAELFAEGAEVITSLAGRVQDPATSAGRVRIGGFGGVAGLVAFLLEERITAVVDASHPFAARISTNVERASIEVGVPLLRLERPGWSGHPSAESWTWVPDTAAAREAGDRFRRPFLTTGRQSLAEFLSWADRPVLVRVVDPPEIELPELWTVIRSRGPYSFDAERALMIDHAVDVMITKDSGGEYTVAKLDAAADLGVPVMIIRRPERSADVPRVTVVADAMTWLAQRDQHPVVTVLPDRSDLGETRRT